jgi:hypothetical protein
MRRSDLMTVKGGSRKPKFFGDAMHGLEKLIKRFLHNLKKTPKEGKKIVIFVF